ncbi:MAG: site-specific integrase [Alphaproteobacteria bacterium]
MKTQENKFNFTKKSIESLPRPESGKRTYYYDTKVRGLGVGITDKGTQTFIVYRKIGGRPERMILGRYPDLSIENARGEASKINAKIAQGENPNREKNKIREELTFKELFARYLDQHAKVHKKSWKSDLNQHKLYLSHWDKHRISRLHKADIEALHAKIGRDHGLYAANRMLALLAVMFSKAISWGWNHTNPTIGIKRFKEKSRERFLQGNELPKFLKALEEDPNQTLATFFKLCLLTGARRSNVLAMRWQDISFDQETWNIVETKNGNSQLVPLSEQALGLLKSLFKKKESGWIFPSTTSKSGHLEEPKNVWKRILKKAELEDLRLHDLRRTLGSWQATTGANSYIIGKSLGHKTQQATAIYARLNIDPVRASVERATAAMMETREKEE